MHQNQKQAVSEWKKSLQESFFDSSTLLDFLHLKASQAPMPVWKSPHFSCLVTKSYARRMQKDDWNDPLLLQVLPLEKERLSSPGFREDPVGDLAAAVAPGLIHKYTDRVLLLPHCGCALHCRYCFRRVYPWDSLPGTEAQWEEVFTYIRKHEEIHEVILSGGDPLMLDTPQLEPLLGKTADIPHIHILRIHTRMPVVCPRRIDQQLLTLIKDFMRDRIKLIMVIQVNHPAELRGDCLRAIRELRSTGMLMFNQSVLLKNINDDACIQKALVDRLIQNGIVPYYLHQLDRARGTGHFEVSEAEGKKIRDRMREILPGYALPRYVKEISGEKAKVDVIG